MTKDGTLDKVQIFKGISGGYDIEAARAISKSKLKAGTWDGVPVDIWYSVPIRFYLRKNTKKTFVSMAA